MNDFLVRCATIQSSWLGSDILIIKYEELISDEYKIFDKIIRYCQIDIDRQLLHDVIRANSFKSLTGRKPGEEDINSHLRKGIAGDWHNHFSKRIKDEFKQRFGHILIQAGYEENFNW